VGPSRVGCRGDYHASGRNNLTYETLAHVGLGHREAALETARLLMEEHASDVKH
jgi:hypothetical protein